MKSKRYSNPTKLRFSLWLAALSAGLAGCADVSSGLVHDDDRNTPRYKKDVREYERLGYDHQTATQKADNDVLWQNWNR